MRPRPRRRDGEWLDFVADLMAVPLTRWPDEQVSRMFVETFDAAGCGYYARGAGVREDRGWPPEHFAPHLDEILHWTEHEAPTRHPLLRYYRITGDHRCLQVADVPTRIVDRRLMDGWRELGRRWGGVQAQMSVPLFAGPRAHRAFIVGRADTFTAQEMAGTHRLQRLLSGLDGQIAAFSRWSQRNGTTAAEAADGVCLTPRELAVLELLASSLTATAIGRRLGIAERTVQKHLQRGYAKLGVADRLAAVQRAQAIGVLRAP